MISLPTLISAVSAAMLLGALAWVIVRHFRGPRVSHPSCAFCRYPVTGLPGHICPECGCELREVGILQPGRIRPMTGLAWAVLWTLAFPFPAHVVASIVIKQIPVSMVWRGTAALSRPGSGAFDQVTISTPSNGIMPSRAEEQDLRITVTTTGGDAHDLIATPDRTSITWPDRDGVKHQLAGELTAAVLEEWFGSIGIDVDAAVRTELDEIVDAVPGPRSRAAASASGTLSFDEILAGGSLAARGGFGSQQSSWSSRPASRDHLPRNAALIAAAIWLIGLLIIAGLHRARQSRGPG